MAETAKETVQEVSPVIIESVAKQAQAQAEYQSTVREIDNAKRNNDMDAISRIAEDMARKALERGVREADR